MSWGAAFFNSSGEICGLVPVQKGWTLEQYFPMEATGVVLLVNGSPSNTARLSRRTPGATLARLWFRETFQNTV